MRRCLVERGVGAVTAWEWMARNIADPDERRRRIAAAPDVANGVIVTDAARLADARAALDHATLDLRIAVLVTPSSDTGPRSEPAAGFVVEPHRALWDREWAERTREEMRARRDRLFDTAETARTSAGHCRRATVKLDEFTRRWPASVAEEKLASAAAAFDAATAACIEAERDVTGAPNKLNDAIIAAAATRPAVEADGARATVALEAGRAAREAADEAAAAAQARIATARAQGEAHRERQLEVGVEPAGEAPDTPVHELRAAWEQLRADLEAVEAGSDHAVRLDEANQRAAEAAVRVQALDASAVARRRRPSRHLRGEHARHAGRGDSRPRRPVGGRPQRPASRKHVSHRGAGAGINNR